MSSALMSYGVGVAAFALLAVTWVAVQLACQDPAAGTENTTIGSCLGCAGARDRVTPCQGENQS